MKTCVSVIFTIAVVSQQVRALEWIKFNVPSVVVEGQDVTLTCNFDVQGDRLFSVNWYKAGGEFYRYVPNEDPRQQTFNLTGVVVDTRVSNDTQVILKEVHSSSSGDYKCEVLTEFPQFKTLVMSDYMLVVDLPKGGPVVTGGMRKYKEGSRVLLNCVAPWSRPATELKWFINGQEAPTNYLITYPRIQNQEGLYQTQLGLSFRAQKQHFPNNEIRMTCRAVLHSYQEDTSHKGEIVKGFFLSDFYNMSSADSVKPNIISLIVSIYQILRYFISTLY